MLIQSWLMVSALLASRLFLSQSSTGADSSDLLSALKDAAGIYIDPLRRVGLNKTVLITISNSGYLDHLMNFKCFCDRLRIKFLVFATDAKAQRYCKASNIGSYLWTADRLTENTVTFRSREFNKLTSQKLAVAIAVMKMGYDLIFSDPDNVILHDPVPHMIFKTIDYSHSINSFCPMNAPFVYNQMIDEKESKYPEGNTGFYFVRSNEKTLKLWSDALANAPKFLSLDDQTVFWDTLRSSKQPAIKAFPSCPLSFQIKQRNNVESLRNSTKAAKSTLRMCALDVCLFTSGALAPISDVNPNSRHAEMLTVLQTNARYNQIDQSKRWNRSWVGPISAHANFMVGSGKKRESLERHGYWLVLDNKGTCASFKRQS